MPQRVYMGSVYVGEESDIPASVHRVCGLCM